MKIFVDFDDVIFNTKEFVSDFKKIFQDNGVSQEVFNKYYYGYPIKQKGGRLKKYDPWEHIRLIKKELNIDVDKLKRDLIEFLNNAGAYVFHDVRGFLESFDKGGLYLISYGRTDFQGLKISKSGVAQYFRKIIITDRLKSEPIKRIVENSDETMYFLEDRVEQIDDVKKNMPRIITILVKRKEGRYDDKRSEHCDHVVNDLKGALEVINSVQK